MKRLTLFLLFCLLTGPLSAQNISKADAERCRAYFRDSIRMIVDVIAFDKMFYNIREHDQAEITESFNSRWGIGKDIEYRIHVPNTGKKYVYFTTECAQHLYDLLHQGLDEAQERSKMVHLISRFRTETKVLPNFYKKIDKKFKGNVEAYVDYLFKNSIMGNEKLLRKFKKRNRREMLTKDPLLQFTMSVLQYIKIAEKEDKR